MFCLRWVLTSPYFASSVSGNQQTLRVGTVLSEVSVRQFVKL